jgi:hypothetical protein
MIGPRSGGAVEMAGSVGGDGAGLACGGASAGGDGTATGSLGGGREVRAGSAVGTRGIVSVDRKNVSGDGIRGAGSASQR